MKDTLTSESAIWLDLTGANQGWLSRCRAVMSRNPTALAELRDDGPAARALQEAGTRVVAAPGQSLDAPVVAFDWHVATRIRGLALAMAGLAPPAPPAGPADPDESADPVVSMIGHAEHARLYSVTLAQHSARVHHEAQPGLDASPQVQQVFEHIRAHGGAAASFVDLLALELADRFPASLDRVTVPVVFAGVHASVHGGVHGAMHGAGGSGPGQSGTVGKLTLELLADGPEGLHPDPRLMCFLRADDQFVQSLQRAWASAPTRLDGACVVWRLQLDTRASRPVEDISGGSLAAAYAVALRDLGRHGHLRRAIRLRTLDPRCAVTAALAKDGHHLTTVTGLDHKIAAAATAGLRLVVAEDDLAAARRTPHSSHVPIVAAPDVDRAERACRTHTNHNARVLLAAIIVIVLTLTFTGVTVYLRERQHQVEVAEQRRKAEVEVADQRRKAEEERHRVVALTLAEAAGEVSERNSALALALASESAQLTSTPLPQATEALIRARLAFSESTAQQVGPTIHDGDIDGLAFSPDGRKLATARGSSINGNSSVRIWNVATGTQIGAPLPGGTIALSGDERLRFSHDNALLAGTAWAGGGTVARVWNLNTGGFQDFGAHPRVVEDYRPKPACGYGVEDSAFSANDTLFATVCLSIVQVWRVDNGKQAYHVRMHGHQVEFSPVDPTLLAVETWTGQTRLWDLSAHRQVGPKLQGGGPQFSPDGKFLATIDYERGAPTDPPETQPRGQLRFWRVDTGEEILPTRNIEASGMAWGPDGPLMTYTPDGGQLWNAATWQRIGAPLVGPNLRRATTVAFSPRGRLLATADRDGSVRMWELPPRRHGLVGLHGARTLLSADGKHLASPNGENLQVWDLTSGRRGASLTAVPASQLEAFVTAPGGFLFATRQGKIQRIRLDGESEMTSTLPGRFEGWKPVRFSPDATYLLLERRRRLRLWNVAEGAWVGRPLRASEPDEAVFSSNGQSLAVRQNNPRFSVYQDEIFIYHVPTKRWAKRPLSLPDQGGSLTTATAFSFDGLWLAAAYRTQVFLYNLRTDDVRRLTGGGGLIGAVAFSRDRDLLAAANVNGEVTLWDLRSGQRLTEPFGAIFRSQHRTMSIAFGTRDSLAATGLKGNAWIWPRLTDPLKGCELARNYVTQAQVEAHFPRDLEPICKY